MAPSFASLRAPRYGARIADTHTSLRWPAQLPDGENPMNQQGLALSPSLPPTAPLASMPSSPRPIDTHALKASRAVGATSSGLRDFAWYPRVSRAFQHPSTPGSGYRPRRRSQMVEGASQVSTPLRSAGMLEAPMSKQPRCFPPPEGRLARPSKLDLTLQPNLPSLLTGGLRPQNFQGAKVARLERSYCALPGHKNSLGPAALRVPAKRSVSGFGETLTQRTQASADCCLVVGLLPGCWSNPAGCWSSE